MLDKFSIDHVKKCQTGLCFQGCIDGVIDYSPTDTDERQHNLQKAIVS